FLGGLRCLLGGFRCLLLRCRRCSGFLSRGFRGGRFLRGELLFLGQRNGGMRRDRGVDQRRGDLRGDESDEQGKGAYDHELHLPVAFRLGRRLLGLVALLRLLVLVVLVLHLPRSSRKGETRTPSPRFVPSSRRRGLSQWIN